MNTQIAKVIEELGSEIQHLAQLVMAEQGISPQSKLYQEMQVRVDASAEPIVIETYFNNYLQFVEEGRQPQTGKKPPIDALRNWAQTKGLPTDNDTLYAISYAIWRDGIEPKPILAMLEERVEQYMDREFYHKLQEAIISELNKYFE